MWKYRHSVKENPKDGYDWSINNKAAAERVLCVSTRTLRMSKTLCSVRKIIQKRADRFVRCHVNWHLLDWLCTK